MGDDNPIMEYLKKTLEPIKAKLNNIDQGMENIKKSLDENNTIAREALDTANSANKNSMVAINMAEANTASISELQLTV